MKIREIMDLLSAEIICGEEFTDNDIAFGFGF